MSHLKERKEKICLNCKAALHGRFCHVCGQENIEPKESFWHLVTHFVGDLVHFDGKFFVTLKYLLFKPGHLSAEHLKGRRADYLHPIRFYIFVSAFFFFTVHYFSVSEEKTANLKSKYEKEIAYLEQLKSSNWVSLKMAKKGSPQYIEIERQIALAEADINTLKVDNTAFNKLKTRAHMDSLTSREDVLNALGITVYNNVRSFDSAMAKLSPDKQPGFLKKKTGRQISKWKEIGESSGKGTMDVFLEHFDHQFPKLLFLSLPLFALLLKLFYSRNKTLYFVDHLIFSLYLYCFIFISILARKAIDGLLGWVHIETGLTGFIFFIINSFVIYKSFKNFYQQSRGKTLLKIFLLILPTIFLFIFLLLFFSIVTFFVE